MKSFLAIVSILTIPIFCAAQVDNGFTISEIGWTFTPPLNFEFIDSAKRNIKLSKDLTIWKKDLRFKNYSDMNNIIACSIVKDGENEAEWIRTRPFEIKSVYENLTSSKGNLKFDSSLTTVTIDDIQFQKFAMVGRENGEIKYSYVQLAKYYKGYNVLFVYMFVDPLVGLEIDKQFIGSKFSK
jgi:hypothetical protein